MRDLTDVNLRASEFDLLASICAKDRDFPRTFDAWHVMMQVASSDARSRDLYPEPLLLDVREFDAWCKRLSVMACLDSLRAFVIIKRREVD